jgi:hypothetical protein
MDYLLSLCLCRSDLATTSKHSCLSFSYFYEASRCSFFSGASYTRSENYSAVDHVRPLKLFTSQLDFARVTLVSNVGSSSEQLPIFTWTKHHLRIQVRLEKSMYTLALYLNNKIKRIHYGGLVGSFQPSPRSICQSKPPKRRTHRDHPKESNTNPANYSIYLCLPVLYDQGVPFFFIKAKIPNAK